jgi:hypothetical protein
MGNQEIPKWFWIAIIPVFIVMPILSTQVGIPADEPIDLEYGKQSLNYFKSMGRDTSFANLSIYEGKRTLTTQKYYGPLFEMLTVAIGEITPFNIFKIRHFITAIAGVLIILFSVLIAFFIGDPRLGGIVFVTLLASNAFIGQAFFNTKDIPFALGFVVFTWYFFQILSADRIRITTIVGASLGLTLAIGIRIGGILLIFYALLFLTAYYLYRVYLQQPKQKKKIKPFSEKLSAYLRAIVKPVSLQWFWQKLIPISITLTAGTILGLAFYPNFWQMPLQHIIEALGVATKFPARITLLFEGTRALSTDIHPFSYLTKYILITFPVIALIGLILFFVLKHKNISRSKIFIWFIFFMAFFPLLYISYSKSNVYNGWRHILFCYPFFVILGSIGIWELYHRIQKTVLLRVSLLLVFGFLIIRPLIWAINNYPYQYIYFNELINEQKILKNYDTDYQQLSSSESLHALAEYLGKNPPTNYPIKIYTNNEALIYQDIIPKEKAIIQVGGFGGLSNSDWDYAILTSIFLDPALFDYTFPPAGTIVHEVKVNQTPLNYLIKRENKTDFIGLYHIGKNELDVALANLLQAYEFDQNNYRIWKALAISLYYSGQRFNFAKELLNKYLSLYPGDQDARNILQKIP